MASTPTFTSTPRIGVGVVETANTARDGTGTLVTVLTAAGAGTKIFEIVVQSTGDPADSIVTLFLHNGAAAFLFDEVALGNPPAASTTQTGFRLSRYYENLVLPGGWSLRAAITVTHTAGKTNVYAFGGDLT